MAVVECGEVENPGTLRSGRHGVGHNSMGLKPTGIPPQPCHPDRSVAQWRDLLFYRIAGAHADSLSPRPAAEIFFNLFQRLTLRLRQQERRGQKKNDREPSKQKEHPRVSILPHHR